MKKVRRRNISSTRYSWSRIVTPIALSLTVAAGGAALSYYQTRKAPQEVSSAIQEVSTKRETLPSDLDSLVAISAVHKLASGTSGGTVRDVALENRSGLLIYAVTMDDGTKLGYNAVSGDAVAVPDKSETTPERESQEKKSSLPADLTISTTFNEARKLAQEAFPNSAISRIKLNAKEGVIAYSVSFTDKAEVDIDASNGSVIRLATPAGATAEAPADRHSPSVPPTQIPSETGRGTSETEERPAGSNAGDDTAIPSNSSDDSDKASGKVQVQIKGVLSVANGRYTITEKGVLYTVITEKDISELVGKTVQIDGKLQADNAIRATKIEPQR